MALRRNEKIDITNHLNEMLIADGKRELHWTYDGDPRLLARVIREHIRLSKSDSIAKLYDKYIISVRNHGLVYAIPVNKKYRRIDRLLDLAPTNIFDMMMVAKEHPGALVIHCPNVVLAIESYESQLAFYNWAVENSWKVLDSSAINEGTVLTVNNIPNPWRPNNDRSEHEPE